MATMPNHAFLVLLGFTAVVGFLLLAAALYGYASLRHRVALKKRAAIGGALIAAGYAVILLATGIMSRTKVLAMGESKYFCEMDCHEAYSIAGLRREASLGRGPAERRAHGTYLVIGVQVLFDADTISPTASARRAPASESAPHPARRFERYDV
jgi:hypothetical protein